MWVSTTPQTPGEGAWFPYYLGVLAGQKLPGMDEVVAGLGPVTKVTGEVRRVVSDEVRLPE